MPVTQGCQPQPALCTAKPYSAAARSTTAGARGVYQDCSTGNTSLANNRIDFSATGTGMPPKRTEVASLPFDVRLGQRELAISGRRDGFAALAELGVAAAVAHDPADLLALAIAVDAGQPRVDLAEQQPLTRRTDVVGPGSGSRPGCLAAGQTAVAREPTQPGRPICS